ncbi:sterol desaturase family protein [Phaeobacter inhibens]|uniref:sterol desaturase family protein n=1 Tax=Phaeobacter inhibens TaxID=221822 RepID=UPI00076BBBA2|nr:sterol desaturase family protein [Phaeobacter inhibens]KXF89138.1 desaturase [Phaeobacter inhibens]WHP67568.1 sterol desaturase family protein [Phaeobacter inhibens]
MDKTPLKGWNHVPPVPIKVSPFFTWPPRPLEMVGWIWNSWFLITEKLILVAVAFVSFYWFQPPLAESREFAFDWIAQMYLRNLVLMTAVAGGLHLYFYTFTKQGQRLRYDPRPLMKAGRQFTLGGQIRDNMFWTLASGVTVWTAYEVLMFWALANGYAPMLTFAAHPIHILFHLQYYALTAATTHTGFEGLLVKDKNRLALGTFHHQMHHRYFECNYGSLEIPWDKFFGSFHDGTTEADARIRERRKRLMKS